jgi:hypothetical protein
MNCETTKRLMAAVAMLYAAGGAQVTPILAVAMLSAATTHAQVQIGKGVQIGGSSSGGATTPATSAPLKGTGVLNGVAPAAASDIVSLFPGTGPCFLKSDGTCAPGGGAPAGTNNDLQLFGTSTSFAADTGNLTNNSATHNFRQKRLNGIPYAGNYTTGSNGIPNAFTALGGSGVIINDSENAGDTTEFGAGTNSTIIDLQNGTLGHRLHNCIANPFIGPGGGAVLPCESDMAFFDTTINPVGTGLQSFRSTSTFTSGPGINNGNIGATDSGWSVDIGQWWEHDAFRDGISSGLTVQGNKRSLGDFQGEESRVWTMGGNTDISGEGVNNLSLQGGEAPFYPAGTITTTTGTGDVVPVVSVTHPIASGSYMFDTQTAAAVGALGAAGSSPWSESTYLSVLPTTAAVLTPSTGDCKTLDDVHLPTIAGTPQSATFRCTVGALGPVTTGFAFLTSINSLSEGIIITSAPAPVGGVQTIVATTSLSHFAGSNLIQGGTHGCMSFDANLSVNGWRSSYTVFGASDSTHMIYGYLTAGGVSGNTIPMLGNEPETLSAPNNGFHIYPCAQVAYVNLAPSTFGTTAHLRQNDVAWHNGDSVELPHNPAVNMHSIVSDHVAYSPTSGVGSGNIGVTFHGFGITGNYQPFFIRNGNADSMYFGHGGWAKAPTAMSVIGPYSIGLNFAQAPDNGQHIININDGGVGGYNLASTAAGRINVAPNLYTFSQSVAIAATLSAPNLTVSTASDFSGTTTIHRDLSFAGFHQVDVYSDLTTPAALVVQDITAGTFPLIVRNDSTGQQQGLEVPSGACHQWDSGTGGGGTPDSYLCRPSANTYDFGSTAGGTNGTINAGKINVTGTGPSTIQIGTNVFSALPACTSGTEGTQAPVTDSTAATWGATITGGGTNHILAYCDGTAWTVAAK